jgi:RNA polymerase sigma-19 factor, ECF subfamily
VHSDPAHDLELLRQIRDGNQAAFSALVARYWAPLVAYAARIGHGVDDAEDVVQDVVIRIWEKRDAWQGQGSVRALLFRMTHDATLDLTKASSRRHRRNERHAGVVVPPVPTPAQTLESSDLEAAITAAVADLSDRRRAMYELTRIHGLSYREAAEVLGISAQTAANHLTAALAALRQSLRAYLDPADVIHPPKAQCSPR